MQQIFARVSAVTPGLGYEWSGISREQIEGGTQATLIFVLGIVFTFLVLAAQYESFIDPLIILLAVPLAMLGALAAIALRAMLPYQSGGVSDVYAQIGFLMLIGLASKNAILIVEFANQLRKTGLDEYAAVRQAAETRLRPILMTSIAFILGIFPLVIANGDGAAVAQFARHGGLRRDDRLDVPEPVPRPGALRDLRADRRSHPGRPRHLRQARPRAGTARWEKHARHACAAASADDARRQELSGRASLREGSVASLRRSTVAPYCND